MKTLVTGASGLLGSNLVRVLSARGEQVRALYRKGDPTLGIEGVPGVEHFHGDIRDRESVARAMKDVSYVYHCAAMVSIWAPNPAPMRAVNVGGTTHVLECALAAGAERVVHISTVDALGLRCAGRPADETMPWNVGALGLEYARTKHEAQQVAQDYAKRGLDVVIANPTFMVGAWDVGPSSGRMILEIAKGRMAFYTGGGNNFVDVEDVVAGLIAMMERGQSGRCYILGGINLTYREAFRRISEVVGARPPALRVPPRLAGWAGELGERVGTMIEREPPVHRLAVRMGEVDHYFDPTRAIEELDLPQTPIERAIERAWQWFCDHGYA